MLLLKRYKTEIIWLIILSIAFFSLRLYQLGSLPIFTDEAIYLHWATVAKADAAQRFISLTDGKQPMLIWLTVVSLFFIKDPLLAGRVVSVFAGFITMIGLFFLGKELFRDKRVGFASSALYLIFPMALVYDRMVLYDTLVGTFCIWGLYIQLLLVRYIRLDIAFILAFVLGGGMLTKTNAFLTAAFLPFTLLFYDWQRRERWQYLLKWGVFAGLSVGIAYLYYSVLRLSPFFYIIDQKNHEFVLSFSQWIENPFVYFPGNMLAFLGWILTYVTPPLLLLIPIGIIFGKRFYKEILFIGLWLVLPMVYQAAFGKIIYPRYIFFMILPLLTLLGFALVSLRDRITNTVVFLFMIILISLWPLYIDSKIVTDIASSPIPKGDTGQFVSGWAAGGGVKEATEFFSKESADKKIFIATQGTFGLLPYAFEIYLVHNPNITIQGYWPLDQGIPEELRKKAAEMPTYVVFYQPCPSCEHAGIAPRSWDAEQVLQVKKSPYTYFTVYKIPGSK